MFEFYLPFAKLSRYVSYSIITPCFMSHPSFPTDTSSCTLTLTPELLLSSPEHGSSGLRSVYKCIFCSSLTALVMWFEVWHQTAVCYSSLPTRLSVPASERTPLSACVQCNAHFLSHEQKKNLHSLSFSHTAQMYR